MTGSRGKEEVVHHVGEYRLHTFLGAGGTASAFSAERVDADSFGQRCCLKIVHRQLRQDPDFERCLRREAAIGAKLKHRNIASLRAADVSRGFLEFEFIDGANLAELAKILPVGRLAPELAAYVALQLAEAFECAHELGVVHRDVSATNVMITRNGEVKLLDFGVALLPRNANEPRTFVRGTMQYMAPEQASGGAIDERADLFALGVLCYELLAGRRPSLSDIDQVIYNQYLHKQYPHLVELVPAIPPRFAELVTRLLEPDPRDRIATAAKCFDALAMLSPPASARRELGRLAREAQEHAAQNGQRPNALVEEDLPAWLPVRTTRVTKPLTPEAELLQETEQAQRSERKATGPLTLEAAELLAEERYLASPRTLVMATTRRGARSRMFPLGVISVVAAATLLVFAAITHGGVLDSQAGEFGAKAAVERPNAEVGAPGGNQIGEALRTSALDRVEAARVPTQDEPTSAETTLVSETTRTELAHPPTSVAHSSSADKAKQLEPVGEGVLHVGVLPFSHVWIDGESVGDSPLIVRVPAGVHVVAVGDKQPIQRKRIRVRPGSKREVFFDLTGEN